MAKLISNRKRSFFSYCIYILSGVLIIVISYVITENIVKGHLKGELIDILDDKENNKYLIKCIFVINNVGFTDIENELIRGDIPNNANIYEMKLSHEHKQFIKIEEGGKSHDYVIFKVSGLPEGGKIKGQISFFHNRPWDKNIRPLWFDK